MAVVLEQLFHVRSISMPSRPQSIALEIIEELNKLRTCVVSTSLATPQTMCNALGELGNLYECIEMFLHLPSNQQELSRSHQKKWVEKELALSIKILDLCTIMRDNLVAMKEHAEDLGLAPRRKDAVPESKLQAFTRSQKKAQKENKNCFKALKQSDNMVKTISALEKDCDASMTVRMLIDVVNCDSKLTSKEVWSAKYVTMVDHQGAKVSAAEKFNFPRVLVGN